MYVVLYVCMDEKDFQEILDIGIALSSEHDLSKLLDKILSKSQEITKADGASIYLVKKDRMIFKASRNDSLLKKFSPEKMKEIVKTFEMPVTKKSMAGYTVVTGKLLNVPSVKNIPASADYGYDPSFDKKYGYETVSMLVIPMINREGVVTGVLQLINSMENDTPVPFKTSHEKIISSFSSQAAVSISNAELNNDLKTAHFDTIFRLSEAAEFRDKETANHIKRVSHYSKLLAEKYGFSGEACELVFWSAPMHDIGKLGIPDAILQKPGPLTPEERAVMEQHTIIGALVLKDSDIPVIAKSRIVALTHHEKYDGTGYPQKIKGEVIPLEGRIVALADVYDALSSKRIYKPPMTEERVVSILKEGRGTHFDPVLIDLMLENIKKMAEIREEYSDKESDYDKFSGLKNADLRNLLK
ncbi:MAG: hypothetical protein A2044_07360 [Candidatus Firestonebacteria bacterium GWA2_43_8]|nr:MAG: hypothetical protein A2044_07360 [Candidatus Firestonebacteria bacterium GWA2_43_8]